MIHNSTTEASAPITSQAKLELEVVILDVEAGLHSQQQSAYVHSDISPSSSSSHSFPVTINSTRRSSPAPHKGLLPIFNRPSSSSNSSPISTNSSQNSMPAPPPGGLNPIAQIFKDQDLGKMIIGFLMPMTAAFLTPYAPTSLLVRKLVFLSISFGFAALWNGILLRNIFPRHAHFLEQSGAAFVLFAFFGLISSFLPDYLQWIPWACFLMVLLPIFWSYSLSIN